MYTDPINGHEYETEDDLEPLYDEWLDDVDGAVTVAGCEFFASDILRKVDPIAYRCGFSDWLDLMLTDGNLIDSDEN